jgi:methyl-accepting chemotaxis protein
MQLDNLKVSTRLGTGFGLVLLLTGGLLAVGLSQLAGAGAFSRDLSGDAWTRAGAVAALAASSQATARATLELSLAGDPAQATAARRQLALGDKNMADAFAVLEAGTPPVEEKALLAGMRGAQAAHAQALAKTARQFEAGDRDGASRAWAGEAGPALDRLQQELAALAQMQARLARAGGQAVEAGIACAALDAGAGVSRFAGGRRGGLADGLH